MLTLFQNAIAKIPEVSDYKIEIVTNEGCELYYVLDKLETSRSTDTVAYNATIYVDKDGKRGAANFKLYPYMTQEDVEQKIKEQVLAAGFALNPFYEIVKKEDAVIAESKSSLKDRPLKDSLKEVVDAVFAANVYENGYLSATEFFLDKTTVRLVNSKGVDLSSVSYGGRIELIPSWDENGEEVEIYHMLKFETVDAKKITDEVSELLMLAKARCEAQPLKVTKDLKVILQETEAAQIFDYYIDDLNYAEKYMKSNFFEIGQNVQGDKVNGTKLNAKLVPYYEGAKNSRAFDGDGVVLKEVELIKDGIALNRFGSNRFGYYLNVERPTGILPVTVVGAGDKTFEEMAKEPYLRCVRFSGMQLERESGYIGGEVRLGFYFDGEKEIPVTGFSISGNMHEMKGEFVYSKEEQTLPYFHGPKYVEIKGMNIL